MRNVGEKILTENSEYADLKNQIQEIALEFPYYGYRQITAELQNRGYVVNHKRILRLMLQEKLLCHKRKFKPVTTECRGRALICGPSLSSLSAPTLISSQSEIFHH